ncbi:MAG: hypothetical protein IPG44_20205 [Anaerolineales bacterium]|jgi:hypothetical protein|nr:hypothetical protein [Chloroflexota bacterium]MBK6648035.1 hypothetical protein [Anaerolineales bacterium]MCC6985311.1 hypothetical protein [Anaerolineales bacterium]
MSSEERRKILQMVADGRISAEEAATLMRALDESAGDGLVGESAEAEPEVFMPESGMGGERAAAPELDAVRSRAHRFTSAFLWIGILMTVFTAWWMFSIQQNSGLNFWFYCLGMPLTFGILMIALGAGSKTSRWLYVNVDRSRSSDREGPRKISLAFPLPLTLTAWFIRMFGSRIDGLKDKNVNEVAKLITLLKDTRDPFVVHVDDSDDGEKVQVFIG